MLLFWPAKIDLQHSTGPAQYGTIVDMQRGLTGSGLIERCKNTGRVYTTARLRTVFLSCRSSVVCGQPFSSTIVLKTHDVWRSKPTVFASPRPRHVFEPVLFRADQLPKEGFVLFAHAEVAAEIPIAHAEVRHFSHLFHPMLPPCSSP